MTYEQLTKANETIKSTDLGKGKEYVEVNQRIKAFRMLFPDGAITTEIISHADGVVIFKATVSDDLGRVLGTGTAYEKEGSTFINKTSYIENCETSAVGRALAMCGIGIDASVASKEEVENAKLNQDKPIAVTGADAKVRVLKYINDSKMSKVSIEKICKYYKVEKVADMSADDCSDYIAQLKKKGINI